MDRFEAEKVLTEAIRKIQRAGVRVYTDPWKHTITIDAGDGEPLEVNPGSCRDALDRSTPC